MSQTSDLMQFRLCYRCGRSRPLHKMVRQTENRTGYSRRCKDCGKEFNRKHFSDPENRRKKNYHRQTNLASKARALHNSAKQRLRSQIGTFTLTLERIETALNTGVCERTGIPFQFTQGIRNPFGPSVDRIDHKKDYSDENVQIVCWAYNVGKAEMSDEEYRNYILIAADFIR